MLYVFDWSVYEYSEVTLPAEKMYSRYLMSINETNMVAYPIILAVIVVIGAITGVIVWYKRKKA